ncbi:hypothetical protein EK21DRAFT_84684 [Setomelanomma holmii]|uniref:Uncharacterized protein n=1 Tax=Setomelanomma holmii TaxID=210430 RepID=A0A9P4HLD2_9PLEO|nr:hypothetical protein EK21DRAFT_84684 [Setomelanomma holmii]
MPRASFAIASITVRTSRRTSDLTALPLTAPPTLSIMHSRPIQLRHAMGIDTRARDLKAIQPNEIEECIETQSTQLAASAPACRDSKYDLHLHLIRHDCNIPSDAPSKRERHNQYPLANCCDVLSDLVHVYAGSLGENTTGLEQFAREIFHNPTLRLHNWKGPSC